MARRGGGENGDGEGREQLHGRADDADGVLGRNTAEVTTPGEVLRGKGPAVMIVFDATSPVEAGRAFMRSHEKRRCGQLGEVGEALLQRKVEEMERMH